jgi:Down-regulated in metastasis
MRACIQISYDPVSMCSFCGVCDLVLTPITYYRCLTVYTAYNNYTNVVQVYEDGALLRPHIGAIASAFAARFAQTSDSSSTATAATSSTSHITVRRGTGASRRPAGHTERELSTLCAVAEYASRGCTHTDATTDTTTASATASAAAATDTGVDPATASKLVALLLPVLRAERASNRNNSAESGRIAVLRTVSALAPLLTDPRAPWTALGRLLGPPAPRGNAGGSSGSSGGAPPAVRRAVVQALEALARHPMIADVAGPGLTVVQELNAYDEGRAGAEEPDFDRVVPALTALSDSSSSSSGWTACTAPAVAAQRWDFAALAAAPAVHHCLHLLHSDELSLRGAATAALRTLVAVAAAEQKQELAAKRDAPQGDVNTTSAAQLPWRAVTDAVLLPALRAGCAGKGEAQRKPYLLVLQAVATSFAVDPKRPALPADLSVLARPLDPEADFFQNMCHLQTHRRARALLAVRRAVEAAEEQSAERSADVGGSRSSPFSVQTIAHYLLPLALHPLHECEASSQQVRSIQQRLSFLILSVHAAMLQCAA